MPNICYAGCMPNNIHDQKADHLERLCKRYPGKSDQELLEIKRFLDRHLEIALHIYLEMTKGSSREAFEQTQKRPLHNSGF